MSTDRMELIKEYIKDHEGLRLKRYKDSVGKWTIGFGHLILPGEKYITITREQADLIFERDFQKHLEQAKKFPGFDSLPYQKQTVIIDMCFNLGGSFFYSWPRFTKYMQEGNYAAAAAEIKTSRYYKQTGRRAKNNIELLLK